MNATDYKPVSPLTSFVDMPDIEPQRMDRSTLERDCICPLSARLAEEGHALPVGDAANVGEAGHKAISESVAAYIEEGGAMRPGELTDQLLVELLGSRPDVQPETISAVRPSIWKITELIKELNPLNILRYDGGKGAKSGQLAVDAFNVRLTGEVDFLYADQHSVEIINLADWKTGHKLWTALDVRRSFQFQFYALLVLKNYPNAQALRVRILNTRIGQWSWSCEFRRHDMEAIGARINNALSYWQTKSREAWPSLEKCSICDCVLACEYAAAPLVEVAANPSRAVDQLIAMDARADTLKNLLTAHADARGDIASTDGKAIFGRGAPVSERKRPAKIYEPTAQETE